MNQWPDGGIGFMHKHPFWGKCPHCPAASGCIQMVVDLVRVAAFAACALYLATKVLEAMINIY